MKTIHHKRLNFHGIKSAVMYFMAFGIGIASVIKYSVVMGIISFILVVLALVCVSLVYCSKCNCRTNCNHWILGKMSVLLSRQREGTYTSYEIIFGLVVPLVIAIAFPQYWLIKNNVLFFIYWGLMIIAGLEVYLFVCKQCSNKKCALCRTKAIL